MRMQLGQIVDYCIEYDNQRNGAGEKKAPKKHKATQAEIDAYFGS